MVQAPPRPPDPEVDIELEDLQELARVSPLAWEQLLHIVDNRRNAEQIEELKEQLRSLGKSSKNLVDLQQEKIELNDNYIAELTAIGGKYPHA